MIPLTFLESLPGAVTICDTEGIILHMNPAAEELFANRGGRTLLGSNVLDCHPEAVRNKLLEMMRNRSTNVYTVEKNGKKNLIYQFPWYESGQCAGYAEIVVDIPLNLPNIIRT